MRDTGKKNVLGVLVDAVDLEAAVTRVMAAARRREPYQVAALAVHGVMTGWQSMNQRQRLNGFDLVVPDGQPVRWGLNLLHRSRLESSVRGTDLTLGVLAAAEREGFSVYLYGSTTATLARMVTKIERLYPRLRIAGASPSVFHSIDEQAQDEIADVIRGSGAGIVFVGLGCPRQETFVSAMAGRIGVPMLAVGAAFDYLAGTLREPPLALRRVGLEWAWRFALEPRRLWRRYIVLNPAFLTLLGLQVLGVHRPLAPVGSVARPEQLEA